MSNPREAVDKPPQRRFIELIDALQLVAESVEQIRRGRSRVHRATVSQLLGLRETENP